MRTFRAITIGIAAASVMGCSQPSPTSPTSVLPSASGQTGALRSGSPRTVPLKGSVQEGTSALTPLDPPFAFIVVTATGNGTELGRFTLQIAHVVNFATAAAEGTFVFTAANGDRLTADFTGHADTTPPIFHLEENGTISGGTGRFAGASGTIAMHRLYNPVDQTTTGWFEGTLTF